MASKLMSQEVPAEYEIIDATVQADWAGEVGGCRVYTREGKRYVKMTTQQAQWFIDQKAMKKV